MDAIDYAILPYESGSLIADLLVAVGVEDGEDVQRSVFGGGLHHHVHRDRKLQHRPLGHTVGLDRQARLRLFSRRAPQAGEAAAQPPPHEVLQTVFGFRLGAGGQGG